MGQLEEGGEFDRGEELTVVFLIEMKSQLRVRRELKKVDDWDGVGLLREDRSDGVAGRKGGREERLRSARAAKKSGTFVSVSS